MVGSLIEKECIKFWIWIFELEWGIFGTNLFDEMWNWFGGEKLRASEMDLEWDIWFLGESNHADMWG